MASQPHRIAKPQVSAKDCLENYGSQSLKTTERLACSIYIHTHLNTHVHLYSHTPPHTQSQELKRYVHMTVHNNTQNVERNSSDADKKK